MTTVILVVHLLLAIALVGVILIQRSEGGGLGIGGGSGMGGFMTGRATANLLSRTTAFLAAGFMATSIALALLANAGRAPKSILDQPAPQSVPAPAPAPAAPLAR
ncbi:MAG: preprotein translocase subunit SecG [Rhodospirillales bacterium RIFCSPLOWO2_12_FULL_67_15]|nr:MAG: preprotein translocase subunit SecG [Rhodospirillales bacterium RIFCSPLOWO2_12_FULL_67_15]